MQIKPVYKEAACAPTCPYCAKPSVLVTGKVIYPGRADLAERSFWRCAPCDAYVGCHRGTTTPLGRLADAHLRTWKGRAHIVFDAHWKRSKERGARSIAYQRLARDLGIDPKDCHIGMFDIATCMRVVQICAKWSAHKEEVF